MGLPSPNGAERGPDGRFLAGNKAGRGNPHGKRVNELRTAMFEAVTPETLGRVVRALVREAEAGSVAAAREVLDRCLGKPNQSVEVEATTGSPSYHVVITPTDSDCSPHEYDLEAMGITDAKTVLFLPANGREDLQECREVPLVKKQAE